MCYFTSGVQPLLRTSKISNECFVLPADSNRAKELPLVLTGRPCKIPKLIICLVLDI